MSEKKAVRKSVAIALGTICIILVAGLGGAISYYTITINNKENEINSVNNTISQLNATITELNNRIAQLESNLTNLQSQVEPKLVGIDLAAANINVSEPLYEQINDPTMPSPPPRIVGWLSIPIPNVSGHVYNVGIYTAYNCTIHVIAYLDSGVLAIDTHIPLGTIEGRSQVSVNASITTALLPATNFTLTLQWTTFP